MGTPKIKVGDSFWSFDGNRRHYGSDGQISHRHYYYRVEIIGETSRSWVTEHFKVPKNDPFQERYGKFATRPVLLTDQMVDDECFVADHRHKIASKVQQCRDAVLLRQVATLMSCDPEDIP